MREYIRELADQGEFVMVSREVDPRFELIAVTCAFQRRCDDAVLFERKSIPGQDNSDLKEYR